MEVKKFPMVDALKFFCALLIVAIHVEPFSDINSTLNSFTVNCICRVAVPFFFICSGFFLFRKIDFENFSFKVIWSYSKKILKFYLIWSVIYLPFSIYEAINASNPARYILSYLQNFVFAAGFGFLWYLPATVVAVLLVGALLKKKVSINKIIVIGIILYIIGLLGQTYFGLIKPLKSVPALWSFLRTFNNVIVTTRNGVFEGFVFVALGAKISKMKKLPKPIVNIAGFGVSLVLLVIESTLLSKFDMKYRYDMYLMLIPCAIFLLMLGLSIVTSDNKIYRSMRTYSTLIYFSHMIVAQLIAYPLHNIVKLNSLLVYLIAVVITLAIDFIIIKLSNTEKFGFIKNIYA